MKSYISRKLPLETRTTDQIFVFRSSEKLIRFRLCFRTSCLVRRTNRKKAYDPCDCGAPARHRAFTQRSACPCCPCCPCANLRSFRKNHGSKNSVRAIAAIEETICCAFLRGDRVRGPGRK